MTTRVAVVVLLVAAVVVGALADEKNAKPEPAKLSSQELLERLPSDLSRIGAASSGGKQAAVGPERQQVHQPAEKQDIVGASSDLFSALLDGAGNGVEQLEVLPELSVEDKSQLMGQMPPAMALGGGGGHLRRTDELPGGLRSLQAAHSLRRKQAADRFFQEEPAAVGGKRAFTSGGKGVQKRGEQLSRQLPLAKAESSAESSAAADEEQDVDWEEGEQADEEQALVGKASGARPGTQVSSSGQQVAARSEEEAVDDGAGDDDDDDGAEGAEGAASQVREASARHLQAPRPLRGIEDSVEQPSAGSVRKLSATLKRKEPAELEVYLSRTGGAPKGSASDLQVAAGHHHKHQHHGHHGYYQYAEVPKKKAWKMGFKRGNHKHTISRHEKGYKNKFHSSFKWNAKEKCKKKGKCQSVGKMSWHYEHHDKKKKHHHHY